MELKLIKFVYKLYDNKLPIYFNEYMPYLEARETKYNLRSHPLPVSRVAHAFAESCLLYKLVKIKNELATYHKLIHAKIIERSHSHSGFSNYVVNIMIDRYSYMYECDHLMFPLKRHFIHVGPEVVLNFEKI